jgi:integrase
LWRPVAWRGVVSLGFGPGGRRLRKAVSARTKTEVRQKVRALREELDAGITSNAAYTVADAVAYVDLETGTVAVWRSVRSHGDVKTEKSRRTLRLPQASVEALREQLERQSAERLMAGALWREEGLVFTTRLGGALDSGNVRRSFRAICKAAGIGETWTPRELRTSFVSLMSHQGISTEEIARSRPLAGPLQLRPT